MGGMIGLAQRGNNGLAWLRWRVQRLNRQWGWPVWIGLALVMAGVLLTYQTWQLEVESARLSASRKGGAQLDAPRPKKPVTENELGAYYETLPHEEERFALVKRVLISAEKHGVLPQQADYKLEAEALTRVVRYQLSLPLKGDFARMQAFIVDVLNENRSVVIDSLNVKRESVERSDVEARVQFSVLMVQL